MQQVEMVFLDAGGTLLLPEPSVGEVYEHVGRRHGIHAGAAALTAAFHDAFRARRAQEPAQGRSWWRVVVMETFRCFGEPRDPEGLFTELYDHFGEAKAWSLMPGALSTLEALRARGYRTGMISNWDERLPALLEGLGLTPFLDPIVISCQVGAEKPDPHIYEVALEAAGVPASRALMVGDDPEADLQGAHAAGLQAVLLDRNGQHRGSEVIPALPSLLERLS